MRRSRSRPTIEKPAVISETIRSPGSSSTSGVGSAAGTRTRAIRANDQRKVAELSQITGARPTVAMRRAPMAGPPKLMTFSTFAVTALEAVS